MFKWWSITTMVWFVLIMASGAGASDIEVSASVSKQTAYIGDLIDYTITITYDQSITLTPPLVGANLGGFDVKDYRVGEEETLDDGRRRQSLWFSIRTFTTGEYVIPPLPIEYQLADSTRQVISSEPVKIEIKSILAEGSAADTLTPVDIRGQVSIDEGISAATIIIIVIAVLVAGGGFWYWWWRRKGRTTEFVDPRTPWEIALDDLNRLREKNLIAQGQLKLFYLELTEIFRRYLGRKGGFEAIDLTTEEIEIILGRYSLDEEFRREIVRFLQDADLIKFAKYVPPADQPEKDWQKACALVEKSREMPMTQLALEAAAVYSPGVARRPGDDVGDPMRYVPAELRDYFADHKSGIVSGRDAVSGRGEEPA